MTDWEIAINALGYAAGVATIVSQRMRLMIPLRIAGIVANLFFILYGALGAIWPPLILHAILLPLNVTRLIDMRKLVKEVRDVASGSFDPVWLRPYSRRERFAAGSVLWRRGDEARAAYYILNGEVLFEEVAGRRGTGSFVGDWGVFAEDRRRTNTVVCLTGIEALVISYEELTQLYFQNPHFGFFLVRYIVGNSRAHIERLAQGRTLSEGRSGGPFPER